jgi:hypothetical protein
METINKETSQHHQFDLSINVSVPDTTININQKYVQEALEQIINELFRKNPEALKGNSPEEIREKLNINGIYSNKPKNTGKWKNFTQGLRQHAMGKEAGEAFDNGRKEFHDNLIMTNPFSNEKT